VDAIVGLADHLDCTESEWSAPEPFMFYGKTEGTEIFPGAEPIIQEYTTKAAVTAGTGNTETYIQQLGHDESKCSTDTGFS